jgi:hypothetical protein
MIDDLQNIIESNNPTITKSKVITLSELTQVRSIIYHIDHDMPIINFQNHLNFIGKNIRFHIPDYILPDENNFVDMDFDDAFILYFYQRPVWTLVSTKPVNLIGIDSFPDPKQLIGNSVYLNSGLEFFNMRKSPRIDHVTRYPSKLDNTFFNPELYTQKDFVPLDKIVTETTFSNESHMRTNSKIYYKV